MRLLVLGASGGCGRWLVELALKRGHAVRAVVRPETPFNVNGAVDVLRGSALDEHLLERAVTDCDAVASALGIKRASPRNPWSRITSPPDLTTRVARTLVHLLPRHGIERVAAISAAGVGESAEAAHPLIRWMILHSNMKIAYEDLERMEAVLAASDLDWLAVRPTTLIEGPPSTRACEVERYNLLSRITRGDVAAWMIDAIERPSSVRNRTPMIAAAGIYTAAGFEGNGKTAIADGT